MLSRETTIGDRSVQPKLMQDVSSNDISFRRRFLNAASIAKQELIEADHKFANYCLIGATATMAAVEYSPLYEYITAFAGVSAQQTIANPNNLGSLIATSAGVGLAAGAASAAEQISTGLLFSGSIRNFPKTFKYWNETKKIPVTVSKQEQEDLVTGYFLSTSASVIEQNARDPERTFKQNASMTLRMAGKVALINTGLISVFSAGVQTMERVGLDNIAHTTESVLKNPIPYFSLFALIKGTQIIKEKRQHKKYNQTLPED